MFFLKKREGKKGKGGGRREEEGREVSTFPALGASCLRSVY